jgi:hypothetical protein
MSLVARWPRGDNRGAPISLPGCSAPSVCDLFRSIYLSINYDIVDITIDVGISRRHNCSVGLPVHLDARENRIAPALRCLKPQFRRPALIRGRRQHASSWRGRRTFHSHQYPEIASPRRHPPEVHPNGQSARAVAREYFERFPKDRCETAKAGGTCSSTTTNSP